MGKGGGKAVLRLVAYLRLSKINGAKDAKAITKLLVDYFVKRGPSNASKNSR